MTDDRSRVANAKAHFARLKTLGHSKVSFYYLNDYPHSAERLRIESTRGGQRTVWTARTTMRKMAETKRYLESVWTA